MLINDLVKLGDLVRRRRTRLNLSQTELAERVGATRQWVSRLENGKHDISTARLFAVLDALELNLDIRPPGSPTAITFPVPNIQSLVPSAALEAIRNIQLPQLSPSPFIGLSGVGGTYSPVIPESIQQTLRALSSPSRTSPSHMPAAEGSGDPAAKNDLDAGLTDGDRRAQGERDRTVDE